MLETVAGRVLGGRYKIEEHLADGGMGSIWTARHLTLGISVAVKLMTVEGAMRADLRARFEQEAKAVALLRHPHIVQVLDYGTDDDTPYIVMELLEGVDLLATREHALTWPLSEVATLVSQVARGLGAAHRAGLIHRDVKPANIFLARAHGEGAHGADAAQRDIVAKVIDFGIAKWAENKDILTAASVVLGSPSYMSPEQIRGHRLDDRVDAWALAVVAFTLVTGEMPFVGKSGPDIAKQIVLANRRAIPPTAQNAAGLERFFARAFARDPAARFGSIEEMAGEFILVAGAPSALHIALRSVEHAAAGGRREGEADETQTQKLSALREDSTTNRLVRSGQMAIDHPEDLEVTEMDDRLNPSGGAAGRNRSSE